MTLQWMDEALKHFEPAPPPAQLLQIREELVLIAQAYEHDSKQSKLIRAPMEQFGESPQAYQARLQGLVDAPRKRGRQPQLAQQFLMLQLRALLMNHGCHYGAPKSEERRSRLVELAMIIHDGVGAPKKRIGWRSIAERLADPVFQLEVMFGEGVQIKGHRTEMKEMLTEHQIKPAKNISKK